MYTYLEIVFMTGDDYMEVEELIYPDREPGVIPVPVEENLDRAFEYLLQWERQEVSGYDAYTVPPWGTRDFTHEVGEYVMSWAPEFGHVSLVRVLKHADYPHEHGRLWDCPVCEEFCHCSGSVRVGLEDPCVHCS